MPVGMSRRAGSPGSGRRAGQSALWPVARTLRSAPVAARMVLCPGCGSAKAHMGASQARSVPRLRRLKSLEKCRRGQPPSSRCMQ
ncbi:hypothetical protein BIWAKO_00068 [Bosea sp. BIWAKO-01]|nr:hypothetical protein BIWAKO_00068 [Bosea sp. BIWAKO-01]